MFRYVPFSSSFMNIRYANGTCWWLLFGNSPTCFKKKIWQGYMRIEPNTAPYGPFQPALEPYTRLEKIQICKSYLLPCLTMNCSQIRSKSKSVALTILHEEFISAHNMVVKVVRKHEVHSLGQL